MTKPTVRLADITHPGEPYPWGVHRVAYSDLCPFCKVRLERSGRISRLYLALREFGYSVTREDVETAYDLALSREVIATDGIIPMLVRSQLREAGFLPGV